MKSNITEFNFGKERVIFERARGYVMLVLQFVQFAMIFMVWIKTSDWGYLYLVFMIGSIPLSIWLLFRLMNFDVKKNMPAEYEWTWSINPEWQKHKQQIETMAQTIQRIENELSHLSKLENKNYEL